MEVRGIAECLDQFDQYSRAMMRAEPIRETDRVDDEEVQSRLLDLLDPDPICAEKELRRIISKLHRYFASRLCPDPENLTGETLLRVHRSLVSGTDITSMLQTYVFGVAANIAKEEFRSRTRETKTSTSYELERETIIAGPDRELKPEIWEREFYVKSFQSCLQELGLDDQHALLSYYSGGNKGGDQKRQRQHLAKQLGITVKALSARVLRLRAKLSDCIVEHVRREPASGSTDQSLT